MKFISLNKIKYLILGIDDITEDGREYGFSTSLSILVFSYVDVDGFMNSGFSTELDLQEVV